MKMQTIRNVALSWLVTAGGLHAAVIATNGGVPSTLNSTTGSEADPSDYVYDAYAKDWGTTGMTIGGGSSNLKWNRLIIRNGAAVAAGNNTFVGSGSRATTTNVDHHTVLVTGAGSSLRVGGAMRVGSDSSHNTLSIEQDAAAFVSGALYVGSYNEGAYPFFTGNAVVVDTGMLSVTGALQVGYSTNCTYNTVSLRNGGRLNTFNSVSIGRYGAYNNVTVNGVGSVWTGTSANLRLGESATRAHHNTLTLADAGLLKLTAATTVSVNQTAEGGSYVQFAAGFLAMNGDRTATGLTDSKVQVWNGTAWIAGVKDSVGAGRWTATYYTNDAGGESAALAATGYAGLAGYTVFTGGQPFTPARRKGTVVLVR